jgi:hypothetical protein
MFPITYRHQFNYAVQGDERWIAGMLRAQIARKLLKMGAWQVTSDNKQILLLRRFWPRSFDSSEWNFFFRTVVKGAVTIDCHSNRLSVTYQISFSDYFILFFITLVGWALVLLVLPKPQPPLILEILARITFIYGLFYAGIMALACYSFNRFIKNCLREFFSSTSSFGVQGKLITSR